MFASHPVMGSGKGTGHTPQLCRVMVAVTEDRANDLRTERTEVAEEAGAPGL